MNSVTVSSATQPCKSLKAACIRNSRQHRLMCPWREPRHRWSFAVQYDSRRAGRCTCVNTNHLALWSRIDPHCRLHTTGSLSCWLCIVHPERCDACPFCWCSSVSVWVLLIQHAWGCWRWWLPWGSSTAWFWSDPGITLNHKPQPSLSRWELWLLNHPSSHLQTKSQLLLQLPELEPLLPSASSGGPPKSVLDHKWLCRFEALASLGHSVQWLVHDTCSFHLSPVSAPSTFQWLPVHLHHQPMPVPWVQLCLSHPGAAPVFLLLTCQRSGRLQ